MGRGISASNTWKHLDSNEVILDFLFNDALRFACLLACLERISEEGHLKDRKREKRECIEGHRGFLGSFF